MTSHTAAETVPVTDLASDALAARTTLATTVLNAHTAEAGVCVVCGSAWPCGRAVLAAHNLEML